MGYVHKCMWDMERLPADVLFGAKVVLKARRFDFLYGGGSAQSRIQTAWQGIFRGHCRFLGL